MSSRHHENNNNSLQTLEHLIKFESNSSIKNIMLQDFIYKGRKSRYIDYMDGLVEILTEFLPKETTKIMKNIKKPIVESKKHVNVAILTIIEPELIAVSHALGIEIQKKENTNINGIKIWESLIKIDDSGQELSILISMIGEARNVPCAIGCERIFSIYDVDLCVLVGIGGGLKDKVKLGDVVIGGTILDFEHQRLEPNGETKKRPDQYPIDIKLSREMGYFFTYSKHWKEEFKSALLKLNKEYIPEASEEYLIPEHHFDVILTGEKLFADGSLPELRKEYHDKIRAVEMEGAGFARSCREYSIPWIVFRGISDYGDKDKIKEWQVFSALSASTAVITFLKYCYQKTADFEL